MERGAFQVVINSYPHAGKLDDNGLHREDSVLLDQPQLLLRGRINNGDVLSPISVITSAMHSGGLLTANSVIVRSSIIHVPPGSGRGTDPS